MKRLEAISLAAFLIAASAASPASATHHGAKAKSQAPAAATVPQPASGWSEVTIKGFFVREPSTWTDNCASKTDQRFAHSEAMVNQHAQWNEELSCIKFPYESATVYVRSSAVDHTGAHTATISACDRDIASAQSPRSKTGSTMGVGEQPSCPK